MKNFFWILVLILLITFFVLFFLLNIEEDNKKKDLEYSQDKTFELKKKKLKDIKGEAFSKDEEEGVSKVHTGFIQK